MSEIDEDVMELAREVTEEIFRECAAIRSLASWQIVARALMAQRSLQREKDAKIAGKRAAMAACGTAESARALLASLPDAIREG